jgi:hypothetical protein
MIKIDTKDLEKLSAYLDDALTPTEKDLIEQQMQTSQSLREALAELKYVKEKVNEIKPLPADPYFETRLMERLHSEAKVGVSVKSYWKPAVSFMAVCLVAFSIFKFQPDLFHKVAPAGGADFASLASTNLKPLLFATDLTADDIFNFALNKYLPINKGNKQIIKLGTDSAGEEYLEVKYAGSFRGSASLDEFTKGLGLSTSQKSDVAKILDKFSDKIASAVLINDKNTIAVNSQLWQYHDQLRTEILTYAANTSESARKKILAYEPNFHKTLAQTNAVFAEKAGHKSNHYLCISPDSVFETALNIDDDNLLVSLRAQKDALRKGMKPSKSINIVMQAGDPSDKYSKQGGNLRVVADKNACRVFIQHQSEPQMDDYSRSLDNIFAYLNSAFNTDRSDNFGDRRQMVGYTERIVPEVATTTPRSKITPKMVIDTTSGEYLLLYQDPTTGKKYRDVQLQHEYISVPVPKSSNKTSENSNQDIKKELDNVKKEMENIKKEMKKSKNNNVNENKNTWEI